jgi:DNA-binding MarR family transcriptional regulator
MAVRQRMKQAGTIPPAVEAAVGVLMAADHLQTTFAEICERHGVTTDQYKVLRILREAPPGGFARGEVAERCIFSRSPDMTRMLDRLTRQGFVKRAPAPGDRRCSVATITRAGRAVLNRIDPEIAAAARRLTKSLNGTQLTQLTELTEAIVPED